MAEAFDVIVVGGGNTANMLAIWRVHGVDSLLAEARDVIAWGHAVHHAAS